MKKLLSLFIVATLVTTFFSCSDDPAPNLTSPVLTAPAATNVEVGATATIDFTYTAAAGFTSSSVSATGGTAVIATDGSTGATTGTISVTFTAGTAAGAASVTLSVTDAEGDVGNATAVLTVSVAPTTFTISSNISANATWETGKTYILGGRISVLSGVTLTIQPGVVVKGQAGTGANATALLVARGGKLDAQGTAALPIIFTSVADLITPADIAAGNFESPNLDPDASGLWGGLIILGKAPISVSTNATEFQIEGIPASDTNGLYGGNDPADNSGTVRYISIRHSGANIGEGNEINGLTLGGVGSGTTIEFVEIVGNQDDGVEFFGGTVNVTNLLIWNPEDDGVDTDQAWSGTLTNFVVIAGSLTDHTLEIDGPEGTFGEGTSKGHTITNGTIKGFVGTSGAGSEMGDFRDGARATISNIFFFNFPDPTLAAGRGDFSLSNNAANLASPTETTDNFAAGYLSFSGLQAVQVGAVAITSVFKNGTSAHATYVTAGANTVGADLTKFNWTYAKKNGALDGF